MRRGILVLVPTVGGAMGALGRGTVRLRFTLLYAVVFLGSGVLLLALTVLLSGGTSDTEPAPGALPGGPAAAQWRIAALEAQLAAVESDQSRRLLLGALVALAVMLVVSVVLGAVLAGRVLAPLRAITAATRRISADTLHERLAVSGPADEVTDLADTIDGLLGRLESSFAAQRRFVAHASHELRTPLATMRASVDVALAKPEPAPPRTVALADRLRVELDRVDRLLDGLLALARAPHDGPPGGGVPVPLHALVSSALAARGPDAAARGLTVDDRGVAPAWPRGEATLLSRVVDNVVDNAVVHSPGGGRVRVALTTVAADAPVARLVVDTDGPVLAPEQVARLGRPFQRLGADRTAAAPGSGLGLSIVAAVAEAHGGRLDLTARPEGGLRVTVTLPSAPAPGEGAA